MTMWVCDCIMFSVIEMKKEIGNKIKKYRKQQGLNQQQLAELLGVTNRAVSNWESGANGVDIELIPEICKILKIGPNEFFDTPSDQPSPETIALARRIEALDAASREFVETCVSFAESRAVRPAPTVSWSAKPMLPMKEHVFAARAEAINERAELKAEAEGVRVVEEHLQETEK